jgi:hypothetical protein
MVGRKARPISGVDDAKVTAIARDVENLRDPQKVAERIRIAALELGGLLAILREHSPKDAAYGSGPNWWGKYRTFGELVQGRFGIDGRAAKHLARLYLATISEVLPTRRS